MGNFDPLTFPDGVVVFRLDYIGPEEIRWNGSVLTIGKNVDIQALLFDANLTDYDKRLLEQCKVAF